MAEVGLDPGLPLVSLQMEPSNQPICALIYMVAKLVTQEGGLLVMLCVLLWSCLAVLVVVQIQ